VPYRWSNYRYNSPIFFINFTIPEKRCCDFFKLKFKYKYRGCISTCIQGTYDHVLDLEEKQFADLNQSKWNCLNRLVTDIRILFSPYKNVQISVKDITTSAAESITNLLYLIWTESLKVSLNVRLFIYNVTNYN
jgi:hypothetical protein